MTTQKKYRLVLVDDEPWVLIGMRQIISWEAHGFEIVGEYGTAEDAWEALAKNPADAIITDIRLPEMSGIELVRALTAEGLVRAACIVSAYRDFEYARQAMELGSCCYLLKPLAIGEVEHAAEMLRERLAAAPAREAPARAPGQRFVCLSVTPLPAKNKPQSVQRLADHPGTLLCFYGSREDWKRAWVGCSALHEKEAEAGAEAQAQVQRMLREAELSREMNFCYANQEMVAEVQVDIAERHSEKLLVPEIAARHYVSAVYLSDCFKRGTGMTIGNFMIHVRLERARHLLEETALPVTEIAAQVGYQDASYFSRLFRKRMNMSPESYRQLHQHKAAW